MRIKTLKRLIAEDGKILRNTETGVTATTIAQDGIAIIVNNENPVENLTSDQVKAIFTGETTDWEDLAK